MPTPVADGKRMLRSLVVQTLRVIVHAGGERARRLVGEALAVDGEFLPLTIETVPTRHGQIRFYCLGDLAQWRARTLFTKEPETIEWIDGFQEGEVFWDIGANVGIYSLYAAVERKARVLAFEPGAANFALINRNIELNKLDHIVHAYCLAFTDGAALDLLNMRNTGFASALSSFGTAVDESGETFVPVFRQGMIGYSLDRFIEVFDPPFPNHLKIDVDGVEDLIVNGARTTLADHRLKSLSIELDSARAEATDATVAKIFAHGLEPAAKRHSAMFETGPYSTLYNYQFRRRLLKPTSSER